MSDNSTADPGAGGDTFRTKDRAGVKTEVVGLDLTPGGGSETLMNGTMPVSAASLPLPAGAATAAKQPALGTAGAASADVVTIQGIASGTVVPVSGTVTASGPLTDTQLRATPVPVSGTVTASGPLTDTQLRASAVPVSLATLPALVAGSAAIGKLAANSGVDIGDVDVTSLPSIPAGNNNIGDVDLASAIPAGTNLIGFVTLTPSTTGGWSPSAFAALTNTKTLVKGSAGTFGGYLTVYNPNATVAYVQIFDAASTGAVTLGTTVADARIVVPATSAANMEVSNGVHMANGIVIACTTTATGSTAPGAGLDGTLLYK